MCVIHRVIDERYTQCTGTAEHFFLSPCSRKKSAAGRNAVCKVQCHRIQAIADQSPGCTKRCFISHLHTRRRVCLSAELRKIILWSNAAFACTSLIDRLINLDPLSVWIDVIPLSRNLNRRTSEFGCKGPGECLAHADVRRRVLANQDTADKRDRNGGYSCDSSNRF